MEILVDYLTFSDSLHGIGFWLDRLGVGEIDYVPGNSRYGWERHQYYNGIHLYFGGGREDVCIEMSGIGCRTLESANGLSFDWIALFRELMAEGSGAHVSRLDVACDDRDGILTMEKLVKHTKGRKYISRARRCVWMDGSEQQILFGSSQSDTRLRIYNKALERGVEEHWIRAEFQLRNEAAASFLLNLLSYGDIGLTYSGVLLNYLRYTTKACETLNNQSRLETAKWWDEFVNTSRRIPNVKIGGLEYNYGDLTEYISKQCASSIKAFLAINGGSLDSLLEMVNDSKLNIKQQTLIKNMRWDMRWDNG